MSKKVLMATPNKQSAALQCESRFQKNLLNKRPHCVDIFLWKSRRCNLSITKRERVLLESEVHYFGIKLQNRIFTYGWNYKILHIKVLWEYHSSFVLLIKQNWIRDEWNATAFAAATYKITNDLHTYPFLLSSAHGINN